MSLRKKKKYEQTTTCKQNMGIGKQDAFKDRGQ